MLRDRVQLWKDMVLAVVLFGFPNGALLEAKWNTNFNVAFSNFGAIESPSSDGKSSISILNCPASRAASFIVCPLAGAAARGASSWCRWKPSTDRGVEEKK